MADDKPDETAATPEAPAPEAPAPEAPTTEVKPAPPPAPDPRDQAIRVAVSDLAKLGTAASERGDQATMERARVIALQLDAALAAGRTRA